VTARLSGELGGEPPASPRTRPEMLDSFHRLVLDALPGAGMLVVVDDLQWVDTPTLDLLLYLAERIETAAVAMVVGVRRGEPGTDELVARLRAHRATTTLAPAPLSEAGVAKLARRRLGDAGPPLAAACAEATRGNPFLLARLLEALAAEPTAPEQVAELAPPGVVEWAGLRLARFGPEARAFAIALAVLGDDTPLWQVAELAVLEQGVAIEAADTLSAAGIVAGQRFLGFEQPVVRVAVAALTPPAAAADAHARAALLVARGDGAPERVAGHLTAAPPNRDPWAVGALRQAAQRAAVSGDPHSAASWLRRALVEPPPPADRPDVLVELARAEAALGDRRASEHLERALESTADRSARVHILREASRVRHTIGDFDGAAADLRRALDELGDADAALAAELRAAWTNITRLRQGLHAHTDEEIEPILSRPPAAAGFAERALLINVATQLAFEGRERRQAQALSLHAFGDGDLLDDEGAEGIAWIPGVSTLIWCGDLDSAEREVRARLYEARRIGSVTAAANASHMMGWLRHERGLLAEAEADLREAVDAADVGWEQLLPDACARLCLVLIDRGELDSAAAALERVADGEGWADTAPWAFLEGARGRLALAHGDAAGAFEHFLAAGRLLNEDLLVPNPAVLTWRADAALAALVSGDRSRALALSEESVELTRRFGAPRPIGIALRSAGLARGGDAGLELTADSVEVLAGTGWRLEHARSLVAHGAALRRAGMRQQAREPLRQAAGIARECGALAVERYAEDELRASGARPRRLATTGPDALTPSELRVAQLAASGMTNREIAGSLFVTVKAVHFHLGNVYRKLGVGAREELEGALADENPGRGS
jgi:DNA-binding CsgD family transcriptional regulator/predicted negative regulator of RcsB-dependent stress response